jgi:hypothetical protein
MQWRHTKGYTDLPTADNATVGFLVSLKYKNQKSEVQFTCHQSPGAFSPSVHTSFLSVETWVRSALRALKRNVKRDLFSSRRWTFSATSIGSVSVSLSLYLSFSLSLSLSLSLPWQYGVRTQIPALVRQVLYHLSQIPSPWIPNHTAESTENRFHDSAQHG